jgi:hypothetical protein
MKYRKTLFGVLAVWIVWMIILISFFEANLLKFSKEKKENYNKVQNRRISRFAERYNVGSVHSRSESEDTFIECCRVQ